MSSSDAASRVRRLATLHVQTYGQDINSVGFAPGRVNLMGDHVDYHGGLVLPIAIEQGTTCLMSRRPDGLLRVTSLQAGSRINEIDLESVDPDANYGWLGYVVGSLAVARERGWLESGVDVTLDSTVPLGAGLSSSASLECSLFTTSLGLSGLTVDPLDVALAAQEAEHRFAHVPCGIMDQATSMLGRPGHALLLDSSSLQTEFIPLHLETMGLEVLLIDTNAHHELSTGGYAERRRESEASGAALGVEHLARYQNLEKVGQLRAPLDRRARHVVTEQSRVRATAEAFRSSRPDLLADLFAASHGSLAEDYEVSCPELDVAVQAALAGGALAARMTGGGFGGSVVTLCRPENRAAIMQGTRQAFGEWGFDDPSFLVVTPAAGARTLSV